MARGAIYIEFKLYTAYVECSPPRSGFVKQLDLYDLIVKNYNECNNTIDLHGKQNPRGILYYLLCCFNLKIILLSIHLN